MARLRADLHRDWVGHPSLKMLRPILSKTPPSTLMSLLTGDKDDDRHEALSKECERLGIPIDTVRHYWHKGKHFSIFSKNEGKTYEELRDELINEMSAYAPVYPTIKRAVHDDPHLLVVDPADIHVGKIASTWETGEEYNSQIAVQRAIEGVEGIISRASSYQVDRVLFVAGNDLLHTDTPRRTTTSGTPQDTDGMWYDNYNIGRKLMVDLIERLMQVADVHVVFCPSNHDFMSGAFLIDSVYCWFRNSTNVTFDVSMRHRKYYAYGDNCIGLTHGDGAKVGDLPLLMAQEAGERWLKKHRYVYTHHVHHKMSKDYGSVCVESLRSPSGTDGWHHRNGYQHAPKAVEAYVHNPIHGQIARLTHIF